MNAFGGMFAAAGYHQAAAAAATADPYSRMGVDPTAHHMHHQAYTASAAAAAAHHQYKVPRLYFKIPRVLPYKEQREKFETDDYFKKLARESEVRFTGFRDRPLHERQAKFQHSLREGNIEMSVLSNGFAFSLIWNVLENGYLDPHAMTRIDFHKERGKVYLDSPVIFNGVSIRWKGYINLEKLDGVGGFRFDDDSARIEDLAMQQQVDSYKHAIRDWDEQQQRHRAAIEAQQQQQAAQNSSSSGNSTTTAGNSTTPSAAPSGGDCVAAAATVNQSNTVASTQALQQQTNSSGNQQQQQSASAQGQVTASGGGGRNAGAGSGVVTATITPVTASHQAENVPPQQQATTGQQAQQQHHQHYNQAQQY